MATVRERNYNLFDYLMTVECDLTKADRRGRTALHDACNAQDFSMAKRLILQRANTEAVDAV
jgi:hypothetical protein